MIVLHVLETIVPSSGEPLLVWGRPWSDFVNLDKIIIENLNTNRNIKTNIPEIYNNSTARTDSEHV